MTPKINAPRSTCALLVLGMVVASLAVAAPATARTPGVNGQIAYDNNTGIFTANPDGSHARLLVPNTSGADWSPDGNKLVAPYALPDGRIGTATINADGTGYTPFPIGDPTLNVGCGTGNWSPDGQRLACQSWDDSNPARNGIYIISPADGSVLTRLTANPLGGQDVPTSYSPDGKRVVFARWDANGNSAGMFIVKTNDGQVRQILPASVILNGGGGSGLVTTGERDHLLPPHHRRRARLDLGRPRRRERTA